MKFSCSEPSCSEMLRTIHELQKHLEVGHQITLEVEETVFNSMEDFKAWKAQYQKDNNVSYKTTHTIQNKKVYNKVKANHYFRCHRSRSSYEAKAVKRKSCKMDEICPSRMIVKEFRDSTVGLTFWKTHRGHKAEIGHTRLSDRKEIAGKAKQGITPMAIIDQVEVLPVQLRDREGSVIETAMQIPQCSASPALPVQDDVQTLLRKIREASSNVSEDRAAEMNDLLKRELNEILNKVQKIKLGNTFQEKEVVNTRSKIEKQRKFHSTKKKSGDKKPTEEEQMNGSKEKGPNDQIFKIGFLMDSKST
ncbi:hypothetical protein WDU94_015367 [Cyamophila willieti]